MFVCFILCTHLNISHFCKIWGATTNLYLYLYICIFTSLSTLSTLCQSSRWIWPLALFCFSALSQASPGCAMCGFQSLWWFVIIMNCDQWGAGLIKGDVWQHGKAGHRGTLSIRLVSGNTITIVDTITIDIISIDNVNLPSSPLSSSPLTSSPLISFKYHWHLCHWHNHLYRGGGKKELLAWTLCRQPWRQPWRTLGLECRLSNWFFDFIDDVVMQEYWESRGTEADPWHECGSTEVNIAWIWSGYGHHKIYNMLQKYPILSHQMTPMSSSGWFENNCTRQVELWSFNKKPLKCRLCHRHCCHCHLWHLCHRHVGQAAGCADGHLGALQLCFKSRLRQTHGRDVSSTGQ